MAAPHADGSQLEPNERSRFFFLKYFKLLQQIIINFIFLAAERKRPPKKNIDTILIIGNFAADGIAVRSEEERVDFSFSAKFLAERNGWAAIFFATGCFCLAAAAS